ncbi:type II toxin-antitoxin system RelE/ParE family toxin [Sphingobium sp. BYY-5]|uniref:type II toxin-antitoxin system RelE/ParE family toxin n=1 Tax=Sphingobium sp. BYY-5 TaxID=2926400 RepID=UPI001FA7332A|nr:type II toxin-antitoxin system RelE/ParE family toxin [Sphingobium sp. BYY-5]MCI4592412.1 type II toxin-antitoxin system RelE/ParE family toxin [Sphingobium sp. BYY-5]
MRLRWTAEAVADRDAIYDYVEARNPRAALRLDGLFSEKALPGRSSCHGPAGAGRGDT